MIMRVLKVTSINRQAGSTKLGLLMTFLAIGLFLTFGLKVGPLYIDHNIVTGYTESLIESGELADLTTSSLRLKVGENLQINNVRNFDVKSIRLSKEGAKPVVTIAYERRVELFFNLDVVAKFNNVLQ